MLTVKQAKEMGVVFVEGDVVKDEDGVAYNESWHTNETGLFDDCQVTSFTDRKHTGDEMPCDGGFSVVVELHRGTTKTGRNACCFDWSIEGVAGDITSWKPDLNALEKLANEKEEKPMKVHVYNCRFWEAPVIATQKQYTYELVTDLTTNEIAKAIIDGEVFYDKAGEPYHWLNGGFADSNGVIVLMMRTVYRRKEIETITRTITYPKPVSEPLNDGDECWLLNANGVSQYLWEDCWIDTDCMRQNRIHLTKENAQSHWDVLFGGSNENN